jgi:hypothetical protein
LYWGIVNLTRRPSGEFHHGLAAFRRHFSPLKAAIRTWFSPIQLAAYGAYASL